VTFEDLKSVLNSLDNYYREPVNSTNACYAGYYDSYINMCLHFHSCNKTTPIKPVGYPPNAISALLPPSIRNPTSLVYDIYFGAGFVRGKENAYADKARSYTTPYDSCPYPDPPYVGTNTNAKTNNEVGNVVVGKSPDFVYIKQSCTGRQ
jgi:hypothetical protein